MTIFIGDKLLGWRLYGVYIGRWFVGVSYAYKPTGET